MYEIAILLQIMTTSANIHGASLFPRYVQSWFSNLASFILPFIVLRTLFYTLANVFKNILLHKTFELYLGIIIGTFNGVQCMMTPIFKSLNVNTAIPTVIRGCLHACNHRIAVVYFYFLSH